MHTEGIQEYLFHRIREKIGSKDSLTDVIAEKLFISTDSAYRRIRGETLLVLEEARTLCEAFSISLDEALNSRPDSISFSSVQLDNGQYGFEKFLQDILSNLKHVASFSDQEIIYLSKDIPFPHNFLFRPLFAFRYFFWMKSILQHPDFTHRKFSIDLLPPETEALGKEVAKTYNSIPCTEIWNTESINSTIAQIEYYREAGYFAAESEVDTIYAALASLVEHLRNQAEHGCKFLPGETPALKKDNYRFFFNRVVLGDTTILATANGRKILYLNYDVLNYLVTQNEQFCINVNAKLRMLMRRATILSNASDKQRNVFFNLLLKKIPRHRSTTTSLT